MKGNPKSQPDSRVALSLPVWRCDLFLPHTLPPSQCHLAMFLNLQNHELSQPLFFIELTYLRFLLLFCFLFLVVMKNELIQMLYLPSQYLMGEFWPALGYRTQVCDSFTASDMEEALPRHLLHVNEGRGRVSHDWSSVRKWWPWSVWHISFSVALEPEESGLDSCLPITRNLTDDVT